MKYTEGSQVIPAHHCDWLVWPFTPLVWLYVCVTFEKSVVHPASGSISVLPALSCQATTQPRFKIQSDLFKNYIIAVPPIYRIHLSRFPWFVNVFKFMSSECCMLIKHKVQIDYKAYFAAKNLVLWLQKEFAITYVKQKWWKLLLQCKAAFYWI